MKSTIDISVIIENKETLMGVKELNSEKISALPEDAFREYAEYMEAAINLFPIQKNKLELSFGEKDYLQAMKWVSATRNNLVKIFADDMAAEWTKCFEEFDDRENLHHDRVGNTINYLLKTATLFYTGLQNKLEKMEAHHLSQVEKEEMFNRHKQSLMGVQYLDSSKILPMEMEQLEDYCGLLNDFVDGLYQQESGLKTSVSTRNYDSALKWIAVVGESLSQIHADDLAQNCTKQVEIYEESTEADGEKIETFVDFLLNNLDILAGDIIGLKLPKKPVAEEYNGDIEGIVYFSEEECEKNILLINDTRIFLEKFRVSLGGTGYGLIGAVDGDAALSFMKGNKPDILMVDDQIPNFNAIDFARKVRGWGYETTLIMLTSDIDKGYMAKALSAGYTDFVIKPIITAKVLEKIAKYLS
ncbi:MAG: response regulator [Defluviitaleaceae bacterium]|nr:response regulator [Defluviitaleaceae bacterium]